MHVLRHSHPSVILYCDYSDLSTDFTLSFRKSQQFQTLTQIKRKNSRYYHWSKILRDTMEEYGTDYHGEYWDTNRFYGETYDDDDLSEPKLIGPFYCGMSIILKLSQFNMFIYQPLSTSVHLEVAHKFSGE